MLPCATDTVLSEEKRQIFVKRQLLSPAVLCSSGMSSSNASGAAFSAFQPGVKPAREDQQVSRGSSALEPELSRPMHPKEPHAALAAQVALVARPFRRRKSEQIEQDHEVLQIEQDDEVVQLSDEDPLPSVGSAGHKEGTCKRCCFFPKSRCLNGQDCEFCHFQHEKRRRKKNKKKSNQMLEQSSSIQLSEDCSARKRFPALEIEVPSEATSHDGSSPLDAHFSAKDKLSSLHTATPSPLQSQPWDVTGSHWNEPGLQTEPCENGLCNSGPPGHHLPVPMFYPNCLEPLYPPDAASFVALPPWQDDNGTMCVGCPAYPDWYEAGYGCDELQCRLPSLQPYSPRLPFPCSIFATDPNHQVYNSPQFNALCHIEVMVDLEPPPLAPR